MKTLLLFAHSYFKDSVVNKALIEEANTLDSVCVQNLSLLYPDYHIDTKAQIKLVREAKSIIWQFPLFWYSVPALLKHWQDEVLTPIYKEQIFKDKAFGVVATMGGHKSDYEGSNASIKELLKPIYYGFERRAMRIKPPFCIYAESFNALPFEEYKKYLLG